MNTSCPAVAQTTASPAAEPPEHSDRSPVTPRSDSPQASPAGDGGQPSREERRGEIHPLDAVALGVISNRMPRDPDAGPCVLCLDLGAATGWALRSSDGVITSGTAAFRIDRWTGGGMRFLRFKRWLTEVKNAAGGLDQVFFEEVRAHAGVDASHAYAGYLAILTAWCEHHRIAYEGVPVGTIKRHITGKGNADKAAVIAAVRALGYEPEDDNEADALALLHWALANRVEGGVQ